MDQKALSEIVQSIRIPNSMHFFSDGSVQSDNLGGQYTIDGNSLIISYSAMDSYTYVFEVDDENSYMIPYYFYETYNNGNQLKTDLEKVLIKKGDSALSAAIIKLLNTSTMEVSIIAKNVKYVPAAPYSDGLFYAQVWNFSRIVDKGF